MRIHGTRGWEDNAWLEDQLTNDVDIKQLIT